MSPIDFQGIVPGTIVRAANRGKNAGLRGPEIQHNLDLQYSRRYQPPHPQRGIPGRQGEPEASFQSRFLVVVMLAIVVQPPRKENDQARVINDLWG